MTTEKEGGIKIKLMSDPLVFYQSMLTDISNASKYIFLEIYRFRNDPIGIRFRDNLIRKCREGVEIRLLIDSWGASSGGSFFKELIELGAEVKFFKKIKVSWDGFTKSHRRDHRKILVIDDEISYIGSANINDYSLSWRESVFRIKGQIATYFKQIILENFRIFNKYLYDKTGYTKMVLYKNFEILRDVPSITLQPVHRKLLQLIQNTKREIFIETPYFLPGSKLRKALMDASLRGVRVNIIIPKKSDVHLLDVLSGKYQGELFEKGVKIFFYRTQNLHAKMFLSDRRKFLVGSSNFDYRSFRYQHEICLSGEHNSLCRQMVSHFHKSMEDCEEFDYESWSYRPRMQKSFEKILVPFRHLF